MDLLAIWKEAQEPIRNRIGETSYQTWFSSLSAHVSDAGTLVVEAPDEFFKNWIIEHYQEMILDVLSQINQGDISLEFTVNPSLFTKGTQTKIIELKRGFDQPTQFSARLNTRFTFDNFVIGPSNRFAHAASVAVSESPAKAYNPLFLYGGVGLGKTHLMQAIANNLHLRHPNIRTCYITSERFTNELIDAIRHRSTAQFRKKYRNVDVLLIDDIHFIAGKESTQEEFFHTFNSLHNDRKQIVISSDRPPKEIANLEERLSSRFTWGLIVDIQPPDYETRVAILHKKLEQESVNVPDDVIVFIAQQIKRNIRELEGALVRVIAYALLEDKPITLEMAKTILKDMVRETQKLINVDMIQKTVAQYYKLSIHDLKTKKRNKNIVFPRQVAMYLSRQFTNLSLPEIGYAFGGKDHTTVLHSCKKIEEAIQQNRNIKDAVEYLSTELQK